MGNTLFQQLPAGVIRLFHSISHTCLSSPEIVYTEHGQHITSVDIQLCGGVDFEKLLVAIERRMDLALLFLSIRSFETDYGRNIIAYSKPFTKSYWTFNAQTEANGFVENIRLSIFSDLELFCGFMLNELNNNETVKTNKMISNRSSMLNEFC